MGIKAVLFDKDGTIIHFMDMWSDGYSRFLDTFNITPERKEFLLRTSGISEDGTLIPNSIIASGTLEDLASHTSEEVNEDKKSLVIKLENHFNEFLKSHPEKIVETCDVNKLFSDLKSKGIIIGVVTADNRSLTEIALEKLGVTNLVSFVACGNEYPNKPMQDSLDDFINKFSLEKDEIAMVGDSIIDMEYGKELGLLVGVVSQPETKEILTAYTDKIVASPEGILKFI